MSRAYLPSNSYSPRVSRLFYDYFFAQVNIMLKLSDIVCIFKCITQLVFVSNMIRLDCHLSEPSHVPPLYKISCPSAFYIWASVPPPTSFICPHLSSHAHISHDSLEYDHFSPPIPFLLYSSTALIILASAAPLWTKVLYSFLTYVSHFLHVVLVS